jgi:hypothetical protein
MFEPALSIIPAKAGIQRLVGLDSRLRGNNNGVEFVQTHQGSIFVATIGGWVGINVLCVYKPLTGAMQNPRIIFESGKTEQLE